MAGVDGIVALEVVDDVQCFSRVRYAISATVPVFPLSTLFPYVFVSPSQSSLYVVLAVSVFVCQFSCGRVAVQEVACMLHVGAHSQLFLSIGFVEPVLSLDVIGFLFPCAECRCHEADAPCLAH